MTGGGGGCLINIAHFSLFTTQRQVLIYETYHIYSKTCVNSHSQKDRKLVFKTNYSLMQVKSIAECSKGSILQYF